MHLQLDESDGWVIPNPETWIDSFSEGGLEAMDKRHGLTNGIEGEGPPSVVQENPNTRAVGWVDLLLVFVVAGRVTGIRAEKAPRLAVVADAAAVTIAYPLDASVGDTNCGSFPAPVHFPIKSTSRESLNTQNLGQGVKPSIAIVVWLGVFFEGGFPVSPGKVELSISCIGVQSQLACIWKDKMNSQYLRMKVIYSNLLVWNVSTQVQQRGQAPKQPTLD